MRAHTRAALLAACIGLLAQPASAALPEGWTLLTRGGTVDGQALPPMLVLPVGTYSLLEAGLSIRAASYGQNDILLHEATKTTTRIIDPEAYVPPDGRAWYFDPAEGRALPAYVSPLSAEAALVVQDLGGKTVSELLRPDGSVLVFHVPEPARLAMIGAGAFLTAVVARLRRKG